MKAGIINNSGNFILSAIRLLAAFIFFLSLYLVIKIYAFTYSDLIAYILDKYNETYYLDRFNTKYFTNDRFLFLRKVLPLLSFLILTVNFYLWGKKITSTVLKLSADIAWLFKSYLNTLKELKKSEKIISVVFLLVILVTRVYLFRRYPFDGDEACSYFAFVKNGFLYTLSYYPTPNNHILYNLICIPFTYIFSDPLWVMRLPNLFIDFLMLILVFIFLLRNTNFNTALLACILTGLSFSCTIYAVHGRGYMLMSFLTLTASFSFFKWMKSEGGSVYLFIFIASCILGGFAVPVFVLPCAALLLYGLFMAFRKRDLRMGRFVLISSVIILTGVLLLYLPVILITGLGSIIQNEFVQPFTDLRIYFFHIIPVASVEAIDYILGTVRSGYLFLGGFLILFLISWRKPEGEFKSRWYLFMVISVVCTYSIMILQRNFAEFRMLTFYGVLFFITLALALMTFIDLLERDIYKKTAISFIGLFFILLIPITFDKKMKVFYGQDYLVWNKKMDAMIDFIDAAKPEHIFVRDKAFTLFLQYRKVISGNSRMSLQINGKSDKLDYDFIILEVGEMFPAGILKSNYKKIDNSFNTLIYKKSSLMD